MYRFAFDNLVSRPVRALLSILGLAVAIGGMVGLFSVAGGISQLVSSTFSMIPGLLVQERGAPVPIFSTLPADWQSDLEKVEGVAVVNPEILIRINVLQDKPVISPPRFLLGFDIPSRVKLKDTIYGDKMQTGRFLNESDIGQRNCLISRSISESTGKGLGDTIVANGHELSVVGIYECGSMLLDCNVLMDMGALRQISRYDANSVSCYYVETLPGFKQKDVSKRIEELFRGRALRRSGAQADPVTALVSQLDKSIRAWGGSPTPPPKTPEPVTEAKPQVSSAQRTPPAGPTAESTAVKATAQVGTAEKSPSPVEVRSADDWAERFEDFTGDLKFFLTLITGVGVTIAVLSIVNVMLMSVTERTIEFGILRANGWSRANIVSLVTLESALLGVAGGVLGAIGGWAAVQLINGLFPERANLHAGVWLMLFALVFSTLLGVLGGLYPAWRAARLSPMDAIRRG